MMTEEHFQCICDYITNDLGINFKTPNVVEYARVDIRRLSIETETSIIGANGIETYYRVYSSPEQISLRGKTYLFYFNAEDVTIRDLNEIITHIKDTEILFI